MPNQNISYCYFLVSPSLECKTLMVIGSCLSEDYYQSISVLLQSFLNNTRVFEEKCLASSLEITRSQVGSWPASTWKTINLQCYFCFDKEGKQTCNYFCVVNVAIRNCRFSFTLAVLVFVIVLLEPLANWNPSHLFFFLVKN